LHKINYSTENRQWGAIGIKWGKRLEGSEGVVHRLGLEVWEFSNLTTKHRLGEFLLVALIFIA